LVELIHVVGAQIHLQRVKHVANLDAQCHALSPVNFQVQLGSVGVRRIEQTLQPTGPANLPQTKDQSAMNGTRGMGRRIRYSRTQFTGVTLTYIEDKALGILAGGERLDVWESFRADRGAIDHELQRAAEVSRHASYPSTSAQLGALFPRRLVGRSPA